MSASLVGSEMCIRDRPHLPLGVRRRFGGGSEGVRRRLGRGSKGVGGAVSYTHLTLPTICSV
eukprot:10421734-Alexandrium_andersonii.AAC.1